MQEVGVADELDVADLEDHVQRQALARLLEDGEGPPLGLAQGRDDALVGEARQGLDEVGVPLAVDAALAAGLEVEDAGADPLLLAVADLALAVKVPHGLRQQLRHVRVLGLQRVPHVVDGHDVALAALLRPVHAQQAHDVARVRVEELPRRRAVDAHPVDLRRVVAHVLDVAQHVAAPVL